MTEIIKFPRDLKGYKSITLSNGLQAFLISDEYTGVSRACLTVAVGALEDPSELQGLSHLLEHTIIQGSKSYPNPEEFHSQVQKNEGSINSSTDLENISFVFDCISEALIKTLEIFASYFISPLFTEAAIDKSLELIQNEFDMNRTNQQFRLFQILRSASPLDSKFNKFGAGNKESLPRKNLRQHIVDFYDKHFSSNLMKLVIYGREDLGALELIAERVFSQIPNKSLPSLDYTNLSPFVRGKNCELLLKIVPTLRQRELKITWFFTSQNKDAILNRKGLEFLIYLLSYKGTSSLNSAVKNTGLVRDASVGFKKHIGIYSSFEITLSLKGKETSDSDIEKILRVVGNYLKSLRNWNEAKMVWEDCKKGSMLRFHNEKNKEINSEIILGYARAMTDPEIATKDILVDEYMWMEYKEEFLISLIDEMSKGKFMNISVLDKELKSVCKLKDKVLGTEYSIEVIPSNWTEAFMGPADGINFSLPSPNPYLPINTKILLEDSNSEDMPKLPQKFSPSQDCIVWFKQDNKFKLPKLYANLRLYSNSVDISSDKATNMVAHLWLNLLRSYLEPFAHDVQRAMAAIHVGMEENAIFLSVNGYSDSVPKIYQTLVGFIKILEDHGLKKEDFEKGVSCLSKEAECMISKGDPWFLIEHWTKLTLVRGGRFARTKKDLEAITYEQLLEFNTRVFKSTLAEWFIYGNITQEQGIKLATEIKSLLSPSGEGEKLSNPGAVSSIMLPTGHSVINTYIEDHPDVLLCSALQVYWQGPSDDYRRRAILYILNAIISFELYQSLSLSAKLGFLESSDEITRGVCGYCVRFLSRSYSSHYIMDQLERCFDELRTAIKNLTEERFQDYKNIVQVGITFENTSMGEEFDQYWGEISKHKEDLDIDECERKELTSLKREEVIDFFEEIFVTNERRLEVHVSHKKFQDKGTELFKERLQKDNKLKEVVNMEEFSEKLDRHPDYYQIRKTEEK